MSRISGALGEGHPVPAPEHAQRPTPLAGSDVWDAVLERQAGPTLTRSGAEERMLALVDEPHAVVASVGGGACAAGGAWTIGTPHSVP